MCGAVSIQYDPALKEELTKFPSYPRYFVTRVIIFLTNGV